MKTTHALLAAGQLILLPSTISNERASGFRSRANLNLKLSDFPYAFITLILQLRIVILLNIVLT